MFKKIVPPDYIANELALHEMFRKLKIDKYFLSPLKIEPDAIYFKRLKHDFHSYYATVTNKRKFWFKIIRELSYVISILEKHKIQHNDLHMGNLMFDNHQLKIIDLETTTNYSTIPPRFIHESAAEKYRLGFADHFHIGADLNQILGYIFEDYSSDIPPELMPLKNKIITLDKEFPYAIATKNNKTSGHKILNMLNTIDQSMA